MRHEVPPDILSRLRLVCLDLPEAIEEKAWAGIRWCVSKKNFAHVLTISDGWPPAYAKAAATHGPVCVLTFRLSRATLRGGALCACAIFPPRVVSEHRRDRDRRTHRLG